MVRTGHLVVGGIALLGAAAAWAQTVEAMGLPPPGRTAWSVFSCVEPLQAPVCRVPVTVQWVGEACKISVADVVEISAEPGQVVRRIRWRLVSLEPPAQDQRTFKFGFPNESASGIELSADAQAHFEKDVLPSDIEQGTRLLRPNERLKAGLFLYDIRIQTQVPGEAFTKCTDQPLGPAIINRG